MKCENCRFYDECETRAGPCERWREAHDDREPIPFYEPPTELPLNYLSDGDGWE